MTTTTDESLLSDRLLARGPLPKGDKPLGQLVLFKDPGRPWMLVDTLIEGRAPNRYGDTLTVAQRLVGGFMETVSPDPTPGLPFALVANEDGISLGLEPNVAIHHPGYGPVTLLGPVFIRRMKRRKDQWDAASMNHHMAFASIVRAVTRGGAPEPEFERGIFRMSFARDPDNVFRPGEDW